MRYNFGEALRFNAEHHADKPAVVMGDRKVTFRDMKISQVRVLPDFPRNPTGKILKREMRSPYWKGRERAI